ncbi:MarR family winged helix-turn-helix transcriptional regulator [Streptomyces sp. T028]|uniref:MarR family winged helix-turn-helix transcriptional regulator n=1 Tax=Streptomyces sp. T028 TaxID=3394379 RepID=UPI003A83BA8F
MADNDNATVHEASCALLMRPNNVSALVARLTDAGMFERQQNDTDKRVAHVRVTAEGRRRIAEGATAPSGASGSSGHCVRCAPTAVSGLCGGRSTPSCPRSL